MPNRPPRIEVRDNMPPHLDFIAGRLDDGSTFLVLSSSAEPCMIRRAWAALRDVRRRLTYVPPSRTA